MSFPLAETVRAAAEGRFADRFAGARRYALLAFGAICFGSTVPAGKLVADRFPILVASCLRVLPAVLILAPLAFRERRAIARLDWAGWLKILVVAALGLYAFSILLFFGLKMTSGVLGSIVRSTSPAATAVAACVALHEGLGWRRLAAISLAILGILAIQLGGGTNGAGGAHPWTGVALLVLAVICGASNTVAAKSGTEQVPPGALLAMAAMIAAVIAAPAAIIQGIRVGVTSHAGVVGWSAMAWMGLALPIGSLCWFNGLARVAGSTAAGFQGLIPASALVLSYLILGEAFHWVHPVGLLIVLGGVLLIGWDDARCRIDDN